MLCRVFWPLAGAAGFVILATGETLVTEHFDYPNGPLVSVSNGAWRTHSGTAGQVLVTNGQILLSQRKSEDVSTLFSGGPIGPDQASALYASFVVKFATSPTGTNGTYFAHFKDGAATTGIRCRIFATTNGAPLGRVRFGISTAANAASSELSSELNLGAACRVVCRMMLADNASTLWIDPQTETDPSVSSSDEGTVKVAAGFAFRESLASGAGMGELTVDDLVIATSFDEVTPAPPVVLTLDICREGIDGVQLRWKAHAGQTYSVWAADSTGSGFWLLASQLWFGDGAGAFTDPCAEPMRIYRVSGE